MEQTNFNECLKEILRFAKFKDILTLSIKKYNKLAKQEKNYLNSLKKRQEQLAICECECGGQFQFRSKSKHKKSQQHQNHQLKEENDKLKEDLEKMKKKHAEFQDAVYKSMCYIIDPDGQCPNEYFNSVTPVFQEIFSEEYAEIKLEQLEEMVGTTFC